MRFQIQTDQPLIFRDGKPFGEDTSFGGSAYDWVMPQTLAGMVRTAVGFSKGDDYFNSEQNRNAILEVGIEKILPTAMINNKMISLAPIPKDIILTENPEKLPESNGHNTLTLNLLKFGSLPKGSGTDIPNPDWLIPSLDIKDKPAKKTPFRLKWDFFEHYQNCDLKDKKNYLLTEMGIDSPFSQFRLHNGINRETGTTGDGRLFSNRELYLWAVDGENEVGSKIRVPLQISFEISGSIEAEKIDKTLYLGGDRKTVQFKATDQGFPEIPSDFSGKKFLKLILLTHGSFGGWCPDWLKPDLNANSIDYVKIPGTSHSIRLRSACVNGWDGISGWDYSKKRKGASKGEPKPMKKLVPPGSVYLIELENQDESNTIAHYFQGAALGDIKEIREGFGLIAVGLADNQIL